MLRSLSQIIHANRSHKRLIYFFFIWTCLCFFVFRLTINSTKDKNFNLITDSHAQAQRGLLQNVQLDYSSNSIFSSPIASSSSQSSISSTSQLSPSSLSSSLSILPSSSSYSSLPNTTSSTSHSSSLFSILSLPKKSEDKLLTQQSTNSVNNKNVFNEKNKILVDKTKALTDNEILKNLLNDTNLPVEGFIKLLNTANNDVSNKNLNKATIKGYSSTVFKTCKVTSPSIFDLEFNNIYWQTLQTNNGTFYLYGAYYDNRLRAGPLAIIRILAMIDKIQPPTVYCQFWFNKFSLPIISKASYIYGWYSKWGNYKNGFLQPYVINCNVPKIKLNKEDEEYLVPDSVSLVQNECDKSVNNLKVINNRPKVKEDFAVCVKGLDFLYSDLSVRLIEWIELLNILGAKKIFLYELEVHENISKVLNYYQQKGLVELTKITLPGKQPNLSGFRHLYLQKKTTNKRQNELIPYNDCLYRNLYSYRYLTLLDIDEVIMPLKHDNWLDLMRQVENDALKLRNYSRASYNVRNVYFLDDVNEEISNEQILNQHKTHEQGIPSYLHMLQHVRRSKNHTKAGQYVKCFHNTERVVSLHNHFPLNCFGTCTTYSINTSLAHLQHYRKDCVSQLKNSCKTDYRVNTVKDTTIWKYKDELIKRTTDALTKLGFFGK